jgi:K+-sensing histidine kinase KdpD
MMASPGCVLVCVTRQVSCERLIRRGAELAGLTGQSLNIVHVAATGASLLGNPSESEALDYLFTTARQHGADLSVLRSDSILETLERIARESKATSIVLGETRQTIKEDESIIWRLRAAMPDIQFHVISSYE